MYLASVGLGAFSEEGIDIVIDKTGSFLRPLHFLL